MNAEKWLILGALAGLTAIAVNKQLRINRHRLAEEPPEADGRSSIDDVPTVQPAALDETVAPTAPL